MTKEDFPEPETPVTPIRLPKGILTLIFFKLLWVIPEKINSPWFFCREQIFLFLMLIDFSPFKYCPVKDAFVFFISEIFPLKIIFPPFFPAFSPNSTK